VLSSAFWRIYVSKNQLKRYWNELDAFASLASHEARKLIGARLLSQLQYFGRRADALPEWRELASMGDPEELWQHWPTLPILTKRDLAARFPPKEMAKRLGLSGKLSSTGGSTGEPTPFLHCSDMVAVSVASTIYCRMNMGWRPGMATIGLWGAERDIGKRQNLRLAIMARLKNDWVVGGYNINSATVERVLHLIRRHRPVAIYGFTSMLEFVARQVLDTGVEVPRGAVSTAWNGGEMLLDYQVDIFQKAFGLPILNWYGGRELSVMAYQRTSASPLEVLRPYLFIEVVDANGKPVSPGETGRLICTSTVCRGSPFLRYEIGDLAAYAPEDADESGIRNIRQLHGRTAGTWTLPNGKVISCLFWNHLFKEFPEVRQFQVVLLKRQQIELRLKGTPLSREKEAHLRGILSNFAAHLPVTIRWMDQIPLTRQGKLVQVVEE